MKNFVFTSPSAVQYIKCLCAFSARACFYCDRERHRRRDRTRKRERTERDSGVKTSSGSYLSSLIPEWRSLITKPCTVFLPLSLWLLPSSRSQTFMSTARRRHTTVFSPAPAATAAAAAALISAPRNETHSYKSFPR